MTELMRTICSAIQNLTEDLHNVVANVDKPIFVSFTLGHCLVHGMCCFHYCNVAVDLSITPSLFSFVSGSVGP